MKKIKIAFFPSNKFEVPYMIGLHSNITDFKQLKNYIYKTFKLQEITNNKENFEILLEDCKIPDFQQINDFATQQDIFSVNLAHNAEGQSLWGKAMEWKAKFTGIEKFLDVQVMQEEQLSSDSDEIYETSEEKKKDQQQLCHFDKTNNNRIEQMHERDVKSRLKIESKWQWQQESSSESESDISIEKIQKKVKGNQDQDQETSQTKIQNQNNTKIENEQQLWKRESWSKYNDQFKTAKPKMQEPKLEVKISQAPSQQPPSSNFIQINELILTDYYNQKKKNLLEPEQEIKYKIYVLCNSSLQPKISPFIYSIIIDNNNQKQLNKVTLVQKKEYQKYLQTKDENYVQSINFESFVEIWAKKDKFDQEQLNFIENYKLTESKIEPQITVLQEANTEDSSNHNYNNNDKQNIQYSREIQIANQVNYYFCDKNYQQDEFILAHSQNEGNWMNTNLLLNFPKIKSVVSSFEEFIGILKKYVEVSQTINFELSEDCSQIRKKAK